MFKLPEIENVLNERNIIGYKGQPIKDNTYNSMSFINNRSPLQDRQLQKTNSNTSADKELRINKIVSIIKDLSRDKVGTKNLPGNQTGISIKDISLSFTDCSEKTIQRELNNLVLKGKLKKIGAKRWSRYAAI